MPKRTGNLSSHALGCLLLAKGGFLCSVMRRRQNLLCSLFLLSLGINQISFWWEMFWGKVFKIAGLDGRKCRSVRKKIFTGILRLTLQGFCVFASVLFSWVVLIWVWFERSLWSYIPKLSMTVFENWWCQKRCMDVCLWIVSLRFLTAVILLPLRPAPLDS